MGNALVKWRPPQTALKVIPDDKRYKGKFEINSSSSDAIYRISFDTAQMCWVCSCPGCIRHGQCKHLTALGLQGRKYGRNLAEGKKYGWLPYTSGSM